MGFVCCDDSVGGAGLVRCGGSVGGMGLVCCDCRVGGVGLGGRILSCVIPSSG